MTYVVKSGDSLYGPFTNAEKAAAWAMENFPDYILRQGLWTILRVSKP